MVGNTLTHIKRKKIELLSKTQMTAATAEPSENVTTMSLCKKTTQKSITYDRGETPSFGFLRGS